MHLVLAPKTVGKKAEIWLKSPAFVIINMVDNMFLYPKKNIQFSRQKSVGKFFWNPVETTCFYHHKHN